ncbi:tRNA pseudouridine(13) synthase TruD [Aliiglaciecola litoralis]|uniref:tRNA pseudouridine synthase D n=1 Tax=Aliiglaciecola litoralis TaxID=582857 RepID=A0ABP3WT14_9ALTE
MIELATNKWQYLFAKPTATGVLKAQPEDFIVREELGYEPSGEGEHIYLWVQKVGLNTAFVAEKIAQFCQLPLRAVTYAGRKDKHALTQQWFGVHVPGKQQFDWHELQLEGLQILDVKRHNKKLRVGNLKGNRFEITLRDIDSTEELEQRLMQVASQGVPNYFGPQRFGETRYHANGGNLALAQKMLANEPIKNRNKRSMAISALRSWLFNEFVSERIAQNRWQQVCTGDVMILTGSNSFFIADDDHVAIEDRLHKNDISLSAPMWGKGNLDSQGAAQEFEQQCALSRAAVCDLLSSLGLKQERRAIRIVPENLHWQIQSNRLEVAFSLPSGCFATSVIREVINAHTVE